MQLTLAKVLARKYFQQVVRVQSLNIAFIIASSADTDEIKQNTKLHCTLSEVLSIQRVYSPLSD